MDVQPTEIPDVKIVTPKRHGDDRGFFSETYNRRAFESAGIPVEFVQDNHSRSAAVGTIRGLHFQAPPSDQAKLVRVVKGRVLDVAVDIRVGSATYGRHVAVELSAENWRQLYVPSGFAHGFCTLEPDTEVCYKVTGYYDPQRDFGLAWDDPDLGIDWGIAGEPTLSEKDRKHPKLSELGEYFQYSG